MSAPLSRHSSRTRDHRLAALLLVGCLLVLGAGGDAIANQGPEPPVLRDRLPRAHVPDCDRRRSRSVGSPGNGRLVRGVLFPAFGPDHFAWNFREQRIGGSDRTRWGHCGVVRAVLRGLAAYRERNPDAPQVAVGDLGLRRGGEIDGHSTHENGRQIDLYYPRLDRRPREPHTVAQVDVRLARELVRSMLDVGAYRVLIGPHIRIATPSRVMRWPNHDDHLHAMF